MKCTKPLSSNEICHQSSTLLMYTDNKGGTFEGLKVVFLEK